MVLKLRVESLNLRNKTKLGLSDNFILSVVGLVTTAYYEREIQLENTQDDD